MKIKMQWKWEPLDECTQRVEVFGGWIILRLGATDIEKNKRIQFRETMVFVPDRDHCWTVLQPEKESEKIQKSKVSEGY